MINLRSIKLTSASWAAVVLAAVGMTTTVHAAGPALQGQVAVRPLTPQEITDYALIGSEGASGLNTVGLGQPAYLEALVNIAVPSADITNVTWNLASKPAGSVAVLDASPLGTNVPVYAPTDRLVAKVAGRSMLRPDVRGQYTVTVSIQTANSGSTNLTQKITAGIYLGINICSYCHTATPGIPAMVGPWSQTGHASFFTKAIDGQESPFYNQSCIVCHTVGYDANTNANNSGFDDIARTNGWTFPLSLTNGNWAAMPAALKNVANIQCENCHGPGSEHAYNLGDTNLISVTWNAGDCSQCHDAKPYHSISAQWNNSRHAVATRTPSGPSRAACARCHTPAGFAAYTATLGTTNVWTGTNVAYTTYGAISCQTCHSPHSATNEAQLRAGTTVKLGDGASVATITNAGLGAFCMNCHQSRSGSYTNSLEQFPLQKPTYAGGSSSFGPHDNPAAEMLEGVNGYTYGQDIPSAAHRSAVTNTCVGCHMQPVATGFTEAGGHTWKMSYETVSGGVTNEVHMVDVCVKCHGNITTFDMVRQDYNGDGVLEGVQTEVSKLLDKLNMLLPSSTYQANSNNYVADGVTGSFTVRSNWPAKFLQGAWNYQLVNNDLSKGVHNAPYAVGLLKASIANLTDDANKDGLPDAWQVQYFGSWTNANAAPNATPAGDGVPNWLKYSLGLDPLVPGLVVPGGVVWANATSLGGSTNTIQIYTAAEVTFDTELGKTYQIQSVGTVSGGWQNVGAPIPGTGKAISYVTPTRSNAQQYYRVAHTP